MQSDEMLAIENHQISFLLLTDISLIPNILKNIYELSHIDKLLFHFLFFFCVLKEWKNRIVLAEVHIVIHCPRAVRLFLLCSLLHYL